MSIEYNPKMRHEFYRKALGLIGTVHELFYEHEETSYPAPNLLIISHLTYEGQTGWVFFHSERDYGIEKAYELSSDPIMFSEKKIRKYLPNVLYSDVDNVWCDGCKNYIGGTYYKDIQKSNEKREQYPERLCSKCKDITTTTHNPSHTIHQILKPATFIECDHCGKNLEEGMILPLYNCLDCSNKINEYDLCEKCFGKKDDLDIKNYIKNDTGPIRLKSIEEIYELLDLDSGYHATRYTKWREFLDPFLF